MAAASPLTTSFQLGKYTLKNRVVVAPMTRGRAPKLVANDLMREYYEKFTAGLVITEGTHVSKFARGWPQVPGIWTDEQTEAWKPIVDAVHAKGNVFFLQLWHQGRQSHSSYHNGAMPVAPSAVPLESPYHREDGSKPETSETPRALTEEEILGVIQEFVTGAKNAIKAGFDGVEIHSANGYLLDQFLQSHTNKRTDKWGGSVENRARLTLEITKAVGEAIGFDKVGVRVSPNGAFGEMGCPEFHEQFSYVIQEVGKLGVVYMHCKDGLAFGKHKYVDEKGQFTLAMARKLLPPSVALMGCCGYSPEDAAEAIKRGDADLMAFGRPHLGNPDLSEKIKNGVAPAEPPAYETWFYPHLFGDNPRRGYVDL